MNHSRFLPLQIPTTPELISSAEKLTNNFSFLWLTISYIISMKFKENLKELRTRENYSQRELAMLMAVDIDIIEKYESGIEEPDGKMLSELADFFNISIVELCV